MTVIASGIRAASDRERAASAVGHHPARVAATAASQPVLRIANGMTDCHTQMAKTKVVLTLDAGLLEQLDKLVAKQTFRNRSQAVEAALADKLQRLARTRLAREAAKLTPADEKRVADEGLADAVDGWPEY